MDSQKKKLCKFLIEKEILQIMSNPHSEDGSFTLRPGVKSPFRVKPLRMLSEGEALSILGAACANVIYDRFGTEVDTVFGSVHGNTALAVTTAMGFWMWRSHHVNYHSSEIETKYHGDAGRMLGHELEDGERVVIVEDPTALGVLTGETIRILKERADVKVIGLMTFLDCMTYWHDKTRTALEEVAAKHNIVTGATLSMRDVVRYLYEEERLSEPTWLAIKDYYARYGPMRITDNWLPADAKL